MMVNEFIFEIPCIYLIGLHSRYMNVRRCAVHSVVILHLISQSREGHFVLNIGLPKITYYFNGIFVNKGRLYFSFTFRNQNNTL